MIWVWKRIIRHTHLRGAFGVDQDKVGSRYKFRRSCFGFIDGEAPGKICETSNTIVTFEMRITVRVALAW